MYVFIYKYINVCQYLYSKTFILHEYKNTKWPLDFEEDTPNKIPPMSRRSQKTMLHFVDIKSYMLPKTIHLKFFQHMVTSRN